MLSLGSGFIRVSPCPGKVWAFFVEFIMFFSRNICALIKLSLMLTRFAMLWCCNLIYPIDILKHK